MNRRDIIKVSGVASVVAVTHAFNAKKTLNIDTDIIAQGTIEESIKANFGTGFKVVEQYHIGDVVCAKIEHLENIYLVQSSNTSEWETLYSSVS